LLYYFINLNVKGQFIPAVNYGVFLPLKDKK